MASLAGAPLRSAKSSSTTSLQPSQRRRGSSEVSDRCKSLACLHQSFHNLLHNFPLHAPRRSTFASLTTEEKMVSTHIFISSWLLNHKCSPYFSLISWPVKVRRYASPGPPIEALNAKKLQKSEVCVFNQSSSRSLLMYQRRYLYQTSKNSVCPAKNNRNEKRRQCSSGSLVSCNLFPRASVVSTDTRRLISPPTPPC